MLSPDPAEGGGKSPQGRAAPVKSLAELLRQSRLAADMTLAELAEAVGCARSYLSAIENEQRAAPSPEVLGKMERAMRLRAGTLIEAAQWQSAPAMVKRHVAAMQSNQRVTRELVDAVREGEGGLDALYRSGQLRRMIEKLSGTEGGNSGAAGAGANAGMAPITLPVEVPLINSVAAGYPTEFTDLGYPARVADQYVRTPDVCDTDALAARVVGDSMEPDYREGDIVVFSPARTVASGMDCFVRLEPDHATTFKRVFFEGEGIEGARDRGIESKAASRVTHIRLQPLNPKYPAKVLEREQVAGVYAAVSVTRSVGG